jgi:biotin carboxyl carrier protein
MKTTLHYAGELLAVEYTQSGDTYTVTVNGHALEVRVLSMRGDTLTLLIDGKPLLVHLASDDTRMLAAIDGRVYDFTPPEEKRSRNRQESIRGLRPEVRSPMPGKILQVLVTEGAMVEAEEGLLLLEAMKMENTLVADGKACVKKVHVTAGDLVDLGQLLVELEFN